MVNALPASIRIYGQAVKGRRMKPKALPADQAQVLFVVSGELKSGFFYNFADETDDINDTVLIGFESYSEHGSYSVSQIEKWAYLEEVKI